MTENHHWLWSFVSNNVDSRMRAGCQPRSVKSQQANNRVEPTRTSDSLRPLTAACLLACLLVTTSGSDDAVAAQY